MIYAINRKTKEHRKYNVGDQLGYDETLMPCDSDGWIKHDGGECPLPSDSRSEIKNRNGKCGEGIIGKWVHGNAQKSFDIIAYRPILAETQPRQWRGPEDGLPPVGTVCLDSDGNRVEVIAHHFEHVVCYMIDYAGYQYVEADPGELRPIRSAEEVAVEAFIDIGCNTRNANLAYQAIRDGKIPGVKLENDND